MDPELKSTMNFNIRSRCLALYLLLALRACSFEKYCSNLMPATGNSNTDSSGALILHNHPRESDTRGTRELLCHWKGQKIIVGRREEKKDLIKFAQ